MSRYILPKDFLVRLQQMSNQYEQKANIKLEGKPAHRTLCFFGAKNTRLRGKQLLFIEHWIKLLNNRLASIPQENKTLIVDAHFSSMKILVCICLFIKHNIASNNSILNQLIDEALGLKHNPVDKKTRIACLITTQEFIEKNQLVNQTLCNKTSLNIKLMNNLSAFIHGDLETLSKYKKEIYPLTRYIVPVTARTMEFTGLSLGYVLGDLYNQATRSLNPQTSLIAISLSGLTIASFGGIGLGLMLVVPSYLSRVSHQLYHVSFSVLLGSIMRTIGTGIGLGTALTIELSIEFVKKSCEIILKLCNLDGQSLPLDGFNLWEHSLMINGNKVALDELDYEPPITMAIQNNAIVIEEEPEIKTKSNPDYPIDISSFAIENYPLSTESQHQWTTCTNSLG